MALERGLLQLVLAACIALAVPGQAAQDNPLARYLSLSAPDCAGPENIIAELAGAPSNQTYLRVQHIGDPGTEELQREIANIVTWDVGEVTGFHAPAYAQRGYRDIGLPVGTSAFQLACGTAGFLINMWTFSHSVPLFGEGPSGSIARNLVPPPAPFRDARSSLLMEARVRVPWVHLDRPAAQAVAQVSFFYYAQDLTSGTLIAHVIGLYDSRPAGQGNGREGFGNDGVVTFASSPLLENDVVSGAPIQFVKVSPGSASARFVEPWSESTLFRAELPYANFRTMLMRMKSEAALSISVDPADYRILLFGVLGEVGAEPGSNVSLGASASDLQLLQSNYRPHVMR